MNDDWLKDKFYVGISGHRDLFRPHLKRYKEQITKALLRLRAEHSDKEIIVLTPLADGADRLIVEAARELGIRYDVILPMPKKLYKKDFDKQSFDEFERLRIQARQEETIPYFEDNNEDNIKDYGEHRDRQYRYVGTTIVDRSDHMIFLFDGVDNDLVGGTADILRYAQAADKPYTLITVQRQGGKQ